MPALAAAPELQLYRADRTHPTLAGSFLAACVLYGAITGGDTRAAVYTPYELDPASATALKQIAAEALAER